MKQVNEGYNISHFEKGDLIIRCAPALSKDIKYNENLCVEVELTIGTDSSYTESPMIFHCVENNLIYLKYPDDHFCIGGKFSKVSLASYAENWMPFIIPDGMTLKDCL